MFPNDEFPNDEFPNDDDLPSDVHDPQREPERQDNLVLMAVGEPVTEEFARHQVSCPRCQRELAAFLETVRLGREVGARREYASAEPSAAVWAGIRDELAGELGAAQTVAPAPAPAPAPISWTTGAESTGPDRRRISWSARQRGRTRLGLVAAGVVLAMLGAVGGYLAGHSSSVTSAHVASNARLTTVPGGPPRVVGTASVHAGADGQQVVVSTSGLPLRNGFYEVWLFDPDRGPSGDMVAVGTLGGRGQGTFTLPGGIDIRAYHVVDISAQSYGGGSRIVHAQSVLRGSLTQ